MTRVSAAEALSATESVLGLDFETDQEATEVSVDANTVVAFSPLRVAAAVQDRNTASTEVAALWRSNGFDVVTSTDPASGSLIVDASNEQGDVLTCQFNRTTTVLSGEFAPVSV